MTRPSSVTVTPIHVADLMVGDGQWMPVNVHLVDHPDARILVDTGLTQLHPLVADMEPRLRPAAYDRIAPADIDIVVNTHLHYDHCGGNRRYPGTPIHVQRREFHDATTSDEYTIRDWVEAPELEYVLVDGEHQLLPGVRLVPGPGHTPGSQFVLLETAAGPTAIVGDLAITSADLDHPETEGQRRVRSAGATTAWLAHQHHPWEA
jgi:N-acyl homoserine lactone hydrolase